MESQANEPPLVVIVGETASGKSALAMELAVRLKGEIICADSRTVYQGMDIGTAKPTLEDRARVPHHLLDVVRPNEPFTVSDFQRLATDAIVAITNRGKLPIMVGGSGLYIDAVLYDYTFNGAPDAALRKRLNGMSIPELQSELAGRGIALPANSQNPRHLMRAIETNGVQSTRKSLRENTLILGLRVPRDVLKARIASRVEAMMAAGFVDEVAWLISTYDTGATALQAPGYRPVAAHLAGELTPAQAKAEFVRSHVQLAKRQRTWFNRNKSVHWLSKPDDSVELVTTFLHK